MEPNKGRGRPEKPDQEKMTATIRVPLAERDKVRIDIAAKAAHQPTAKWARMGLIKLANEGWKP